jgi:asparagine synthase (glutamine-hydrolysing)
LSIIDLSSGDQPMISADRRVCVVFNGEIYNFRELAAELSARGHRFRTQSDTEVLIHAWEEWGTQCVDRFNGMFAFALWDRESRQLFLARDRLGIKPLYYALTKNGKLLFASELKALQAHPDLERQIDERAIVDYFTLGYIPDPRSIYGLVHKLPPGHWMLMDVSNGKHRLSTYWDIQFDVEADDKRSVEELGQELLERLQESVRMQLVADVPLGAFLSGGVDSSAVVAMMAGLITDPVRTCAIAFDDPDFDE